MERNKTGGGLVLVSKTIEQKVGGEGERFELYTSRGWCLVLERKAEIKLNKQATIHTHTLEIV